MTFHEGRKESVVLSTIIMSISSYWTGSLAFNIILVIMESVSDISILLYAIIAVVFVSIDMSICRDYNDHRDAKGSDQKRLRYWLPKRLMERRRAPRERSGEE